MSVLVVATPCPLILAAPVALVSGVSRAARAGVIVKGAAVIERLGAAGTVMLDKTGTLTLGVPVVEEVRCEPPHDAEQLLRVAASLDQASAHVMARALVREARSQGLELTFPTELDETPGQGIRGRVGDQMVTIGSRSYLRASGVEVPASLAPERPGTARILVGIDGRLAGAVLVSDRVREDAADLTDRLHAMGVERVLLVTGDQQPVADAVAAASGVDQVHAEMSAEAKMQLVQTLRGHTHSGSIVMVGDGINDTPALALADVGIALGAATATAASETADAVIVVDRIDRVTDAISIGRRSMRIARQSVIVGLALSCVGMALAAVGLLPPVAGALAQEAIDVAVILNALRALRA